MTRFRADRIPRQRRKWNRDRRCQDCGRPGMNTTEITFWATGYRYIVCRDCIRPYRAVILQMPRLTV